MKRAISLIVVFFCALALATCDKKITRAIPVVSPCDLNETNSLVRTNASSPNINTRKILLEDYTGHFCGNCPRAARKAEALIVTYGSGIVVMANHVTDVYALPQSDTLYRENFMNEASTGWDNIMKISAAPGLPRGAVNRTIPYAIGDAAWEAVVVSELAKPQEAKLEVTSYYDSIKRLLRVKVKTTFLQAITANVNVIVALTQDSIVADQKDYFPPAGVVIKQPDIRPDYVFNHLVLGSANGVDGQQVKVSPAQNDTATILTPCFNLTNCFYKDPVTSNCVVGVNDKHVNVVAFLVDANTHTVIQVEQLKIK